MDKLGVGLKPKATSFTGIRAFARCSTGGGGVGLVSHKVAAKSGQI